MNKEMMRAADAQQVGGDEREAFEAWVAKEWPGLVIDRAPLMGFYKGDDGARLEDMWAAWQAALAADGGEDKRDAVMIPRTLIERLLKWRLCMSYNDSYFGEPAGELKRLTHEIQRKVDASGVTDEAR